MLDFATTNILPLGRAFHFMDMLHFENGKLYFSEFITGKIYLMDSQGADQCLLQHHGSIGGWSFFSDTCLFYTDRHKACIYKADNKGNTSRYLDLRQHSPLLGELLVSSSMDIYLSNYLYYHAYKSSKSASFFHVDSHKKVHLIDAHLGSPKSMALDENSRHLYQSLIGKGAILRWNLDDHGVPIDYMEFTALSDIDYGQVITGFHLHPEGGLWICLPIAGLVLRLDSDGRVRDKISTRPLIKSPLSCAYDSQHNVLYVVGSQLDLHNLGNTDLLMEVPTFKMLKINF